NDIFVQLWPSHLYLANFESAPIEVQFLIEGRQMAGRKAQHHKARDGIYSGYLACQRIAGGNDDLGWFGGCRLLINERRRCWSYRDTGFRFWRRDWRWGWRYWGRRRFSWHLSKSRRRGLLNDGGRGLFCSGRLRFLFPNATRGCKPAQQNDKNQ